MICKFQEDAIMMAKRRGAMRLGLRNALCHFYLHYYHQQPPKVFDMKSRKVLKKSETKPRNKSELAERKKVQSSEVNNNLILQERAEEKKPEPVLESAKILIRSQSLRTQHQKSEENHSKLTRSVSAASDWNELSEFLSRPESKKSEPAEIELIEMSELNESECANDKNEDDELEKANKEKRSYHFHYMLIDFKVEKIRR